MNVYTYVGNSPVNAVDPWGKDAISSLVIGIIDELGYSNHPNARLLPYVLHYFFGNGEAMYEQFSYVDIGLMPIDFPNIQNLLNTNMATAARSRGRLFTCQVNYGVSRDVGDLVYGHVTFRLHGTIEFNEQGWNFNGYINAPYDTWNFNALPWGVREWWKEIATRAFGGLPGGQQFNIIFDGRRNIIYEESWGN